MAVPTPSSTALSVVIPVYDEAENVEPLHAEIAGALDSMGRSYEVIYVNDGSRDGTEIKLAEIAVRDHHIVVIDLRRNFGQTAAIAAGIDQARGDVIVLMDADQQNDPADIGAMLDKLDEGYDLVSGWRHRRRDGWLVRRLPSQAANTLISWVTGVHLHDYGCTLKAYRREVVREIRLYGEMHRFIPVFASAAGARIAEMKVNHRRRERGKSKYGLGRTLKVILDLITVKFLLSYRTTPMYLFGGFGFVLILGAFLAISMALYNKFANGIDLIRTPLTQLSATLLAMGIQSILLGLTTELLVRTYYEAQAKPTYVIRRIIRNEGRRTIRQKRA